MQLENLKPSDFTNHPWGSVFQKSENEVIAANIMKILERTGNEFRGLTYEEYKVERLKDDNYSDTEERFFKEVIGYCKSAETAVLFSKSWDKTVKP